MLKRVLITGAAGTIGTVMRTHLTKEYDITSLDIVALNEPNSYRCDVSDYESFFPYCKNQDAIVHLALNGKVENFRSGKISPDTPIMSLNVYKAALEAGVARVIMASSVHADNFYVWKGPKLMQPESIPVPTCPYGANKIFTESLGRHYVDKGLQTVCIRFGGVNADDKPSKDDYFESAVWLSHRDCTNLVKKCLDAKSIPNNFLIVYGVSNNNNRIHDTSNPLGWTAEDGSK